MDQHSSLNSESSNTHPPLKSPIDHVFTFFANIRIQSLERLQRLQICIEHLQRVKAQAWVFNIRGELKHEAAQFLRASGIGPLHVNHLESDAGWSADTLNLLTHVRSEFVVFVVEDQFLMCNPLVLENTVAEMHQLKVDHLDYSWHWPRKAIDTVLGIPHETGNYLTCFELNLKTNIQRHKNYAAALGYNGSTYGAAMISIMRTTLLEKICANYQFERRRFNRHTPFDVERSGCDIDMFPIRTGYAKTELFAALDDDNIVPGSALQHRGMFQHLSSREALKVQESDHTWLYRDLHFQVPSTLTQMPDTNVQLRVYKYASGHEELVKNLSSIAGVHIVAMAEALKLDPSIDTLVDYESLAGMVSLLFLKVFGKAWATYRSEDDPQAVRAHENIFSNRIYAGYTLAYLQQRVTVGVPAVENAFRIYADYGVFGPANASANGVGNRLAYVDLVQPRSDKLMSELEVDLQATNLRVLVVYSNVQDSREPGSNHQEHQLISHGGFTLHASNDFALEQDASSTLAQATTRRCAIYRR